MIIMPITEQQSPEWFQARVGVPSASQFDRIFTTRLEQSKSWQDYAYQLAGERLTGVKTETYQNYAMQRGTELEEEARSLYQLVTGNEVEQVGHIRHDSNLFGCSPDGLVKDGLIEIKCPLIHTAVKYLIKGGLPSDYYQQVHGSLAVTGLQWVDFVSYYPGLPLHIHRVHRDDAISAKIIDFLVEFAGRVDAIEKQLKELKVV